MKDKTERPFPSVLEALLYDDPFPLHLLYRLSDLEAEEMAQFKAQWPKATEDRRSELTRHMADIVEDNYVVDFGPIFAHAFTDPAPAVRIAALDGLWDSTDPSLIEPIIGIMQRDASVDVRAAAARALAHYVLLAEWGQMPQQHADKAVAALLVEYERPTTAPAVKRAALEAMAAADTPRINELILDAYENGSMELQLSAIFAMGSTAERRWLELLIDELESPSPDFRAEAARAVGAIGDSDSIDALEQLITDEDLEVSMAAVLALGQIGGDKAFAILTALSENPEFEDLYDVIDEALEEMEWSTGSFDMLTFSEDDDESEDGIYLN
jgi:HEAT repeat protein